MLLDYILQSNSKVICIYFQKKTLRNELLRILIAHFFSKK